MLNLIWLSFFVVAFLAGCYQWFILGNQDIWNQLIQSTFASAKLGFDVSMGLVGVLCLWLGLLKIAEEAGAVRLLSRFLAPLFHRLMPDVPKNHPALGSMTMNIAANILGLDNAATPMGLKAMQELQELNPVKHIASNAQILFLVLNASSVTLLPVTIFMYRAQQGAVNPASVFIPILLATSVSTFVGVLSVAWVQKIQIWNRVVLAYLAGYTLLLCSIIFYFSYIPPHQQMVQSSLIGNLLLFMVIISFLITGYCRKIRVYDTFIEGAKDGFHVAVRIIPYLVAMLVGIGVFRACGALEGLLSLIQKGVLIMGWDPAFVPALPTAFIKPFSGSGARAMLIETMQTYGVDSFPALVSAIIQGSTETTFYVLAVYFGSVGITHIRHAVVCALLADIAGIITSILLGYWFF